MTHRLQPSRKESPLVLLTVRSLAVAVSQHLDSILVFFLLVQALLEKHPGFFVHTATLFLQKRRLHPAGHDSQNSSCRDTNRSVLRAICCLPAVRFHGPLELRSVRSLLFYHTCLLDKFFRSSPLCAQR